MIHLDPERCYRAAASRDARFDGWFYVAVRTTGIYCRPSCPAVTPKRTNVEFHPSAAAAQQRGFRACKRCRPDASPGSPEWNVRADTVARAMRLVADGVVDRDGVAGLADRLGYSVRHVTRLLDQELGAGPLALARSQRAQTARILVETSAMPMTDIAFAAGFGSVRQFNDTIREVYGVSPSALRSARSGVAGHAEAAGVSVRLATRQPFHAESLFAFLAARAVPGVEHWDGEWFSRTLDLPRGHGIVRVAPADGAVRAVFVLEDWRDLAPGVQRMRRLLDLDADPAAVDEVLGAHAQLGPLVRATPGRRSPATVDAFETAVKGIIGQQVSVAGARTVTGRLAAAHGEPLRIADDVLTHVFPSPAALAALAPGSLPMPDSRRRTISELATRVDDGRIDLGPGAARDDAGLALLDVPGIGPWTASYVQMRGLGDPDVFLSTDLGVRHALDRLGAVCGAAEDWRPWRSYAVHHLWGSL